MAKKIAKHVRHIPQRTCVGCRQVLPKQELVRLVRTAQGIQLDPTGKVNGRGAYLHLKKECWEAGLKGSLAHALKTELSDTDRAILQEYMNRIPEQSG
jgi:predicted RNA-binding protein YlxR (DUF448 family)